MNTVTRPDVERAELLAVEDIEVVYDGAILAVVGVSLRIEEGGIVALLGPTVQVKAPRSRLFPAWSRPIARGLPAARSAFAGRTPQASRPMCWHARALSMCWRGVMCLPISPSRKTCAVVAFAQPLQA